MPRPESGEVPAKSTTISSAPIVIAAWSVTGAS